MSKFLGEYCIATFTPNVRNILFIYHGLIEHDLIEHITVINLVAFIHFSP